MKKLVLKMFRPTKRAGSLTEITEKDLRDMGVKIIALDADNTSSYDRTRTPVPGAVEWINSMKNAGFKLVLLSNGKGGRIQYLADLYGIPVIFLSMKPLPAGYVRAVLRFRKRPSEFVMIGDQLFTDIWGANMTGFKSIYCKPAGPDNEQKLAFAIKRIFEKITFWYMDRQEAD